MKVGTRPPGTHARVVADTVTHSEGWHAARQAMIGGSDVGSLCGLNDYCSPYALWLDKTGRVPFDDEMSEAAEWGHLLEPVLLAKVASTTEYHVLPSPGTLQHPVHEFMGVNLDGLAALAGKRTAVAVIEAKTSGLFRGFGNQDWPDNDSVPETYMLQIQHELEVTGLDTAILTALIAGHGYRQLIIHRDDELIKLMIEQEERFWEYVVTDTPPPVDGLKSTSSLLNRMYEVEPESITELPDRALSLLAHRQLAKKIINRAEERKALAENSLKTLLGPAVVGQVRGQQVVTWKESKSGNRVFLDKTEKKKTNNERKAS